MAPGVLTYTQSITCSEVRAVSKISTGGTGMLIIPRCLLCVVLEPEANNTHLGMTFFFHGCRAASRRVASVKSLSLSCIYAILDSKRLGPRKLIR